MITPEYCQTMARYNAWQNQSMFHGRGGLTDTERELPTAGRSGVDPRHAQPPDVGRHDLDARFDGGEGPTRPIESSEALTGRP
jgi:hypothetical protein